MVRKNKDWIKAYLDFTSHSESPTRFHFWTAVSVIAGALRKKVWLDMGYFRWTPNFFVFLVAPPGIASKSTSANIGMSLLRKIEGVHFGPSSLTWQGLIKALVKYGEAVPIIKGDLTSEVIEMSAITVVASELGTFLDPHNREMIDVLVDLWDGKDVPWEKITATQGEDKVINPWVNLIACTTPSWVADNFTNNFVGGGFASRCVFVFGESKRKLVAYPFRHLPCDSEARANALVADLQEISNIIGEYHLTPAAVEWGEDWYQRHYHDPPAIAAGDKFQGYISRKQTHLHKLAMILAAARHSNLVIEPIDLEKASLQLSDLEKDMPRVFSQMNKEQVAQYSSEVIEVLQMHGAMLKSDLFRVHFLRKLSYDTFAKVLEAVINSKLVEASVRNGEYFLSLNEAIFVKIRRQVEAEEPEVKD